MATDDRGWQIFEVVDYDPLAVKATSDERCRLEQDVIQVAKFYVRTRKEMPLMSDVIAARRRELRDAVNALLAFQSESK